MGVQSIDPVKLVYCYDHEDEGLKNELEKSLAGLRREYRMEDWSNLEISPGKAQDQEMREHLNSADIILLLISPSFVASDNCYNVLMPLAINSYHAGKAVVIPVLLRPVDWQDSFLQMLPKLPSTGKPLVKWSRRDDAFRDISRGIRRLLKEVWLRRGETYYKAKHYLVALAAFDRAIALDSKFAPAHVRRGCVLCDIRDYPEAERSFNAALSINPSDAYPYYRLGSLLYDRKDFKGALLYFEKAIQYNHLLTSAHIYYGFALERMGKIKEALDAYDHYLDMHPGGNPLVSYFKRAMRTRAKIEESREQIKQKMSSIANSTPKTDSQTTILTQIKHIASSTTHFQARPLSEDKEPELASLHVMQTLLYEIQEIIKWLMEHLVEWIDYLQKEREELQTQAPAVKDPVLQRSLIELLRRESEGFNYQIQLTEQMREGLDNLENIPIAESGTAVGSMLENWKNNLRWSIEELESRQQQAQQVFSILSEIEETLSDERPGDMNMPLGLG